MWVAETKEGRRTCRSKPPPMSSTTLAPAAEILTGMAGASAPAIPDPRLLGAAIVGGEFRLWTLHKGSQWGLKTPVQDDLRGLSPQAAFFHLRGAPSRKERELQSCAGAVSVREFLASPRKLLTAHLLFGGDFALCLEGSYEQRYQDATQTLSALDPPLRRETYLLELARSNQIEQFDEIIAQSLPAHIMRALLSKERKLALLRNGRWASYGRLIRPGHPLHPAQTCRTISSSEAPPTARFLTVCRVAARVIDHRASPVLQVAAGFGATQRASRTRAVSEAIERFAVRNGTASSLRVATEDELLSEGKELLGGTRSLDYASDQFCFVPGPALVPANAQRTWVPATSITSAETLWAPYTHVFNRPDPVNVHDHFRASTSAAAAHSSLRAATAHATNELLERDTFLRWWYDPFATVQMITVPTTLLEQVRTLHGQGIDLRFRQLPSALGDGSTILALLSKQDGVIAGLSNGADTEEAALKSFSEVWMLSRRWPTHKIPAEKVSTALQHMHFWATCGPALRTLVEQKVNRVEIPKNSPPCPPSIPLDVYRVELLTPNTSRRRVVRVLSPTVSTLVFGYNAQPLGRLDALLGHASPFEARGRHLPHLLG